MNARERLKDWAEYAEDRDMVADSAALRELDQLLSRAKDSLGYDGEHSAESEAKCPICKLLYDLAQAGYGEK